jgi:hypothetical protein
MTSAMLFSLSCLSIPVLIGLIGIYLILALGARRRRLAQIAVFVLALLVLGPVFLLVLEMLRGF